MFWMFCVQGNLFQRFFVTTSLVSRWINVFLFFFLDLKSGFLKFMNTIYMFGCYLKTWVHLAFCFYYGTRKKCVNMNVFLKWKLSKRWLLDEFSWKKISLNFCIFVALESFCQAFIELKHRKKLTSKWIV